MCRIARRPGGRTASVKIAWRFAVWLLAFGFAAGAGVAQTSQARVQHLTLELAVPQQQLARGAEITVGLHFQLEKGWHIYWGQSGGVGRASAGALDAARRDYD